MGARTLTYSRVVHLSHVIAPDMPQWPGDPPLEIATVAKRGVHGYYLRRVAIGEHSAPKPRGRPSMPGRSGSEMRRPRR